MDLECVVNTTGVKDNIVLNNAGAKNEFIIEYNIKGLSAKKIDNQTIQINNKKGKTVYTISAPYMYDAKGNQSTKLTFNVLSNKNGKLRVKLTADKGFLSSWGRAYPVTIDPEITVTGSPNIETAEVLQSNPNHRPHQQTSLRVGKYTNPDTNQTTYYTGLVQIKNILENYSEKNIVSAKLNIFPMSAVPEMEIEARPIFTSWSNSTASYNSINFEDEIKNAEVIDYAHTESASSNGVTFDLTKYAKKWASGSMDNNGVCLTSSDRKGDFGGYYCYYNESRPTFVVKYKDYTGLESNLTSHSVPCGKDAVFSVCDHTGSLSVKQQFFEENTARLPLSIYGTYHSLRNSTNEHTGYGWHCSFNQTVSEDNNYYIYIDADGVNHYFKKENQEEISDEDEIYTLKYDNNNNKIEIDDGEITKSFEIVDNTDIYKIKLEKSDENENNTIQYFYNNAGYMNKITTSLGDYRITRTNEHLICDIQTPSNKTMTFVYYGGTNKISRFRAIDNKATRFNYTSYADDGLLTQAIYSDGTNDGGKITCSYNSDNKVQQINEYIRKLM